jgi:hypothetical protein
MLLGGKCDEQSSNRLKSVSRTINGKKSREQTSVYGGNIDPLVGGGNIN